MALNKLERSNKAHIRLAHHYDDVQRKTKMSNPKSFWAYVKSNYHHIIYARQNNSNKLITKNDKRELYKSLVRSCADDTKKFKGAYVPNKFR